MEFLLLRHRLLPGKTSLAARSKEKRLYSQAIQNDTPTSFSSWNPLCALRKIMKSQDFIHCLFACRTVKTITFWWKIYTIIIILKIWKRWQWSLSKYWDRHQVSTYWTGFHLKEGYRDGWGTNRDLTLGRCLTHTDACKKFWLFMLYNLVGYCLLFAVNNNLQYNIVAVWRGIICTRGLTTTPWTY